MPATLLPLDLVLGFPRRSRLPLHITRRIRSSACKLHDVVDDMPRPTVWVASRTMKLSFAFALRFRPCTRRSCSLANSAVPANGRVSVHGSNAATGLHADGSREGRRCENGIRCGSCCDNTGPRAPRTEEPEALRAPSESGRDQTSVAPRSSNSATLAPAVDGRHVSRLLQFACGQCKPVFRISR